MKTVTGWKPIVFGPGFALRNFFTLARYLRQRGTSYRPAIFSCNYVEQAFIRQTTEDQSLGS
jgi:peptide methionine sulfoxide reductase MsrA